jgi:regulation of enolase protein 1 (concanavalin A-like superfamily)
MGKRLLLTILLAGVVCAGSEVASAGPLVGYWPFDGSLKDMAGTANGTFVGGTAAYEPGQIAQAISFDGVDDYVNIPSTTNPAIYTISAWVKPAKTSSVAVITRTDASGPTTSWSHQLRINASGQFHHYLWVGAERNIPGTTAIVPDTWYHVVISAQNNGPMRLYVNGQEDAPSISTAGTLWATGDRIFVGSNSGHGMGWFKGLVDDLRIYDRELSAAQIKDMFNGIPPAFTKAEKPIPADGTVGVNMPLLQWTKGETALFHDVYVGTSPDLTKADQVAARQMFAMIYLTQGLQPGVPYYWRVDEIDAAGTVFAGDVWSFVTQALTAYLPSPVDQASPVSPTLTLSWLAGQAALKHHLYLGSDLDAVTQGAADVDKGILTDATFDTGPLAGATTYYWRVDETLADNSIKTGPVWSFTTFLPVDDFEAYTDDEGSRIYETWVDGWTNGTGSQAGNTTAPFAEQTVIHGGKQAMPLDYNNVKAPFYSEAECTFSPLQDWTVNGVTDLTIWLRGEPISFQDKGDNAYTVSAGGTDIWNNADAFRFAYKKLNGNGSITARVDSIVNTNAWAKAGVMIRETLDAGSKNALVAVTPGNGVSFQDRDMIDGASVYTGATGIVAPYWVRLTRTGNAFKAERSADGKTWTQVGTTDAAITMGASVYIGLALTSHDAALATTAEFSNVATTGNVTGSWQVAAIGADRQPGNSPDKLYVAVEDSAGKTAVAVNPDPAAVLMPAWTEWKIPLNSLTGINLAKVKTLYIGVGDRDNPVADGSGRLYIDDIRITKP